MSEPRPTQWTDGITPTGDSILRFGREVDGYVVPRGDGDTNWKGRSDAVNPPWSDEEARAWLASGPDNEQRIYFRKGAFFGSSHKDGSVPSRETRIG